MRDLRPFQNVLLGVLSGLICIPKLLLVLCRQFWWFDGNRQLVELAGEGEGGLIVTVVHRRAGLRTYVESLVEWQTKWNCMLHLLRRDDLAVHHQCSGSGTAKPAQIVEGKRSEAESVIFEVE